MDCAFFDNTSIMVSGAFLGDCERVWFVNAGSVHKLWVFECFSLLNIYAFYWVAWSLLTNCLNILSTATGTAIKSLSLDSLIAGSYSSNRVDSLCGSQSSIAGQSRKALRVCEKLIMLRVVAVDSIVELWTYSRCCRNTLIWASFLNHNASDSLCVITRLVSPLIGGQKSILLLKKWPEELIVRPTTHPLLLFGIHWMLSRCKRWGCWVVLIWIITDNFRSFHTTAVFYGIYLMLLLLVDLVHKMLVFTNFARFCLLWEDWRVFLEHDGVWIVVLDVLSTATISFGIMLHFKWIKLLLRIKFSEI